MFQTRESKDSRASLFSLTYCLPFVAFVTMAHYHRDHKRKTLRPKITITAVKGYALMRIEFGGSSPMQPKSTVCLLEPRIVVLKSAIFF